jgi:NAD(P)H-nitrite reductase large subunit
MMRTKYLSIGNSAGGIGAAEAIREVDRAGSITIISDEPYPPYSRPLISKYLTKERTLERMLFRPVDFYSQNNIVSLLGKKVKGLGLESHTAELNGDERVVWEKLLLATGGIPIVPRIEGIGKGGVFTFTTIDDAKAIDGFLDNADKAVVIGGGLIGISVTEALVRIFQLGTACRRYDLIPIGAWRV